MKIGHAAALALMGWYLIVPPYVWPYNERDLWAPVSQWKIVQRFDNPTTSESYLQDMKEDPVALRGEYGVAPKFTMEGFKKMGEMGIGLFALKYARRIFSDDPHLDEN